MNDNKVQNPKTEVPQTPEMNDKDYLNDMLSTEKAMVNHYSYAINEASNDTLYQEINHILEETSSLQRELYNLMFEKGWYSLEKADQQKIMEKQNAGQQQLQELPTQI